MSLSTMTAKGQTTIPKPIREAAGLHTGDRIHFTVLEDGTIIMRAKHRSVSEIQLQPKRHRHVAVADMNR